MKNFFKVAALGVLLNNSGGVLNNGGQKNSTIIKGENNINQQTEIFNILKKIPINTEIYQKNLLYFLQEEEKEEIITTTKEELEKTPLMSPKIKGLKKNFGNILGESQASTIMNLYNNIMINDPNIKNTSYITRSKINFPLIYPRLKKEFPDKLENIFEEDNFKKYRTYKDKNHIYIVKKCKDEDYALAYYQEKKLKLATYVSPGTSQRKTIKGNYPLKLDNIYRKSMKYGNAPMPYAIQIHKGYFMHQGESNGKGRSHGCIRVPGLYQKWIYENFPKEEPFLIIDDLY